MRAQWLGDMPVPTTDALISAAAHVGCNRHLRQSRDEPTQLNRHSIARAAITAEGAVRCTTPGRPKHTQKGRACTACLRTVGKPPHPRSFHTATAVGNKIVFIGGSDASRTFKQVYITAVRPFARCCARCYCAPVPLCALAFANIHAHTLVRARTHARNAHTHSDAHARVSME